MDEKQIKSCLLKIDGFYGSTLLHTKYPEKAKHWFDRLSPLELRKAFETLNEIEHQELNKQKQTAPTLARFLSQYKKDHGTGSTSVTPENNNCSECNRGWRVAIQGGYSRELSIISVRTGIPARISPDKVVYYQEKLVPCVCCEGGQKIQKAYCPKMSYTAFQRLYEHSFPSSPAAEAWFATELDLDIYSRSKADFEAYKKTIIAKEVSI